MSSEVTSSPVLASTFLYRMRLPVLRLSWLKLTLAVSEVAGNSSIGQLTSDRRRLPFQEARGAAMRTPLERYRTCPTLWKCRWSLAFGERNGASTHNLRNAN